MVLIRMTKQTPSDIYLRRLKDHHSIIASAVQTMHAELPHAASYPRLQSRMTFDLALAQSHMEQIEAIITQYGDLSLHAHETVSSVLTSVSSLLHGSMTTDVLSNALAAAGYKAHQIASYDALIVLANHLNHHEDTRILSSLRAEERKSAEWLEDNMANIVQHYLVSCA